MSRFIASLSFLISSFVFAQQVTLVDQLKSLSAVTEVTFSYDAELLGGIVTDKKFQSVRELEVFFQERSALRLERLSGSEFLIVPQKSSVSFFFKPLSDTGSLQEFYVDIVKGESEVLFQDFLSDPEDPISFLWTPRPYDTIKVISTAHDPVTISGNDLLLSLKHEVKLKEKVTYLEEVVIENYLAKGINLNVAKQTTSIEMSDLALIPGETDGDVLASLATLPGVNSPDSRPGNLYVRGSSPDQNLLIYNNIPIYHRGHFFGTISPFNPAVVADVEVFKNGLDPSMGGRVGGAIVINSYSYLDDFESIGFGINSLYGNAFLKQKVGKKVGVSLSGRRSLPSGFQPPKLVNISDMVYAATALTGPNNNFDLDDVDVLYEDYNINILFEPNEQNRIKLSGLLTQNATEYVLLEDTTRDSERFAYDNQGVSLDWEHTFNDKTSGTLVAFFSEYRTEYQQQEEDTRDRRLNFDVGQSNEIQDVSASYQVTRQINSSNELLVGAGVQQTQVEYDYRDIPIDNPPLRLDDKTSASVLSGFANYSFIGPGKFYFQIGGRADYFSRLAQVFISPRLLLNYDINQDFLLKASVSRHYQFLNQIKLLQFGNSGFDNELWQLPGDENIKPIFSNQFMVGGILSKGPVVFDIEAYRKTVDDINYATTTELNPMTTYESAMWDVSGFDIFSKTQITNGFSLWTSYEYSEHTVVFDADESTSYTYKYNRPHRFKMGGLYQKGRWKLSFSWKILSGMYGRSLEALDDFENIGNDLPDDGPPDGGPPDGMPPPGGGPGMPGPDILTIDDLPERYPTFKSLDLFVTYELPKTRSRKWKTNFGLSLINVFDNQNLIDQVVRGGDAINRRLLNRYALGFSPNLNITISR